MINRVGVFGGRNLIWGMIRIMYLKFHKSWVILSPFQLLLYLTKLINGEFKIYQIQIHLIIKCEDFKHLNQNATPLVPVFIPFKLSVCNICLVVNRMYQIERDLPLMMIGIIDVTPQGLFNYIC